MEKYVPEIDYRFQLVHECLCTNTNIVLYIVGTTKIEYIAIIMFSNNFLASYRVLLDTIKEKYLGWLFKNNLMEEFDYDLKSYQILI